MKVIVADCEVFKHYFLLVAKDMATEEEHIIESREDLLKFYNENVNSIWVFYNAEYDRNIIKAKLIGTYDVRAFSDAIIVEGRKPFTLFQPEHRNLFPLIAYDAKTSPHGLKKLEAFMGEDICETTVPFDLDRPLTQTERDEVIYYCKHDVDQTCKVLKHIKASFSSHLAVCKEFNLDLIQNLFKTTPKLAEAVLTGKYRSNSYFNDEFDVRIPDCIQLSTYNYVRKWFDNMLEQGRKGENVYQQRLECDVAGVPHVFAWGGVHGAIPKYSLTNANIVALDVTSYYPSMIIQFGYHSRNWSNPQQYNDIYKARLEFKANKDPRQLPYKLALNSSYGLLKDKYSKSYDPRMANSICITGQLLLLMLMERVEKAQCADLIQSNSDGVYYHVHDLDKLREIYHQWESETGMVMEEEFYKAIFQKDVNNYILISQDNSVKTKGALLKERGPLDNDMPIIRKALVEYFLNGTPPAKTINEAQYLIDFQIVKSKPSCFDAMKLNGETYDLKYYRLFAAKGPKYHAPVWSKGDKTSRVSGAPESCKLDNSNINGVLCPDWLNKNWYIDKVREILTSPSSGFAIDPLFV